jgi:hypothetical protein
VYDFLRRIWNWWHCRRVALAPASDPARDLSYVWIGPITVEIVGVGKLRWDIVDPQQMAMVVGMVQAALTGEAVVIPDVRRAPWRVLSYDSDEPRIVVDPVFD